MLDEGAPLLAPLERHFIYNETFINSYVNTLRPGQDGRHFGNENILISITISLKFVLNGPINNMPALVYIMAWRRPGDKPLHEPMMV